MKRNRCFHSMCTLSAAVLICGPFGFSQNTTSASSADKKFLRSALEGGNAEVKLGQLAEQKGSSDDVKQFGQKMVDDHTRLGDQMKQIAQQQGINVPDGMSSKCEALEKKLNSLSGDAFDKMYIRAMLQDHKKDFFQFKKEADSGNDTSIKDAATQGAQVISEHLQMVEQMAQRHNVKSSDAISDDTSSQPTGHREQQH